MKVIIKKHSFKINAGANQMQMEERKRLLEKYKVGEEIEPEDAEKIQRLCDIGLMRTGLNIENMCETARTTSLGIAILKEI